MIRRALVVLMVGVGACGPGGTPSSDASLDEDLGGIDADATGLAPDRLDVSQAPRDQGVDAPPDVTSALPDVTSAPPDVCDPLAHVDCFFSVTCNAGTVQRTHHAPYPCCDTATCAAAYARNVCLAEGVTCPSMRCNARRFACNELNLAREYQHAADALDLTLFCEGGGRRSGDRCGSDEQCAPQVEGMPGRLRCDRDAGVCAPAPRPAVPSGIECVWDDDCAEGERCDCAATDGGASARRCAPAPGSDAGVPLDG